MTDMHQDRDRDPHRAVDAAADLRDLAAATEAAQAATRGEIRLDFAAAGTVPLPPVPDGEIMVVRSLRLPTSLELRAKTIAAGRGVPTSEVLREAIADWLDRAEAGQVRDPVTELHTVVDAATRALRALAQRRAA